MDRGNDPTRMQDFKSLCVAVKICATLVGTHTHWRLLSGYIIPSAR